MKISFLVILLFTVQISAQTNISSQEFYNMSPSIDPIIGMTSKGESESVRNANEAIEINKNAYKLFSQNTIKTQKFQKLNFQISTPCSLYEDKTFKSLAKNTANVKEALVCPSEINNALKASVYNVIIYNVDGGAKTFITNYATELRNSGIPFTTAVVDGIPALEYKITQNGIPTKAMVFYRYGLSYLFQISSKTLLDDKFLKFKNSFKKLY